MIAFSSSIRRWGIWGSAGILSALFIFVSHKQITHLSDEDEVSVQIDSRVLSYLSVGYGGFFSSIEWVRAITTYAGVLFDGDASQIMPSLFQRSCDLDTNWAYPRLIGALALVQMKGVSPLEAFPFLEDGAQRFPDFWQFRIFWAMNLMSVANLDSTIARDSAAKVLLPLSSGSSLNTPQYARNLAFTLLHKSGKPDQAIDVLVQTYRQVPDPLIRHQFQRKIGDLLWRNEVFLGTDSSAFVGGIGSMLDADPVQAGAAKALLIRLVQPETKDAALLEARHLARQFRSFQAAQLGTPQ